MRVGSLFSGVGGLDKGFADAGFEIAFQVEIDPWCRRVLAKHWPDVPRYMDVRDCGKHNLAAVDVLIGGFPCQPFSLAGKRRGELDSRNLWPEMRRIAQELRPAWVVCENVPGIIGSYLDTVLADLEGAGYATWPFTFPACAVGAPHRRERLFVVAYTDRHQCDPGGESARRQAGTDTRGGGAGAGLAREELADAESARLAQRRDRLAEDSSADSEAQTLKPDPRPDGHNHPAVAWERDWPAERRLCRVADGVPHRLDRIRGLGNSVVPQVAQWIAERIMEAHHHG